MPPSPRDQAKTLREGLQAEITNLWDSGITLTLTSIAADKNDPANSRTLTFAVQGDDVAVGQQLSFSVGDKNANFDVVVPSSAVHTDAERQLCVYGDGEIHPAVHPLYGEKDHRKGAGLR